MSEGKQILIAGCGQLGSRHLQSLGSSRHSYQIDLLDPLKAAAAKAHALLDQAGKHGHVVEAHSSVGSLKGRHYDFIVVATNSDQRLPLLQALFEAGVTSRGWLLEKVLAQSVEDAVAIDDLLSGHHAWVNCPRRLYECYTGLRSSFNLEEPFEASFRGANWGLACNSVHYLDLFHFLFGQTPIAVQTNLLHSEILPSKRVGFVEYMGTLLIRYANGSTLSLTCDNDIHSPAQLRIKQRSVAVECSEESRILTVSRDRDVRKELIKVPLQSELTLSLIERFFAGQDTGLTKLSDSVALHKPFLASLLAFHNSLSGSSLDRLPIT